MISKSERSYYNAAKSISKLSDHRCKIGCVVVKNHKIISSGHNSKTKCHARQALTDKSFFNDPHALGPVHAEFDAINYLINQHIDLSGAQVYVYRENYNGELAPSRPCPRCMALIKACGIKKIKYTGDKSFIQEIIE